MKNEVQKVTQEMTLRSLTGHFEVALQENGITPEKLAQKLHDELEATVERAQYIGGENKKFVYSKAMPDFKIRQEARKDAQKLMGLYPKEEKGNITLNFFTQIVEAADPMK